MLWMPMLNEFIESQKSATISVIVLIYQEEMPNNESNDAEW